MDIKMGTRTFLESEVSKTIARPDLYEKMMTVDPEAPTQLEHEQRAVTKLRYMQFREQQSSTCSHGFRIEAMKLRGAPPITDLKKVKSHSEVLDTIRQFLGRREDTRQKILERLKTLRTKVEESEYFKTHEVLYCFFFFNSVYRSILSFIHFVSGYFDYTCLILNMYDIIIVSFIR